MDKLNLTIEQKQAAAILEDHLNDIITVCEWIQKLTLTVLSEFFTYDVENLKKLIKDIKLPPKEKTQLSDIIINYSTYQLNIELAEYLSANLKDFVDNIVHSVYN